MNKTTIELERQTHYPGWGRLNEVYNNNDASEVLDALVEWTRKPSNLTKKVYRHKVRGVEENLRSATNEEKKKAGKTSAGYVVEERCDLVHYLDIYWQ